MPEIAKETSVLGASYSKLVDVHLNECLGRSLGTLILMNNLFFYIVAEEGY